MRRRDFITLLGGAAAGWPLAAWGQQDERARRVGLLVANDTERFFLDPVNAFREGLAKLGWIEQRNLQLDILFAGTDLGRIHDAAIKLLSLSPDVVVTTTGASTAEVRRQTQTIPIIITGGGDPGATQIVRDIAHPEGNITGITNLYASIGGKWVELLKQAAPDIERIGLVYSAQLSSRTYLPSIEAAAQALAIKTIDMPFQDTVDIMRGIDAFAGLAGGGLIVVPPAPNATNRTAIRRLAEQHRLPTLFHTRELAVEGGLMAYGSNPVENWRRAASFVARILRGTKVSDLPLEFPTKFELAINLKTARALGLTVPPSLLAAADEVIE